MYKDILVPIDFSSEAANAVDTAIYLAKSDGSKVHLLNVIEDPYSVTLKKLGVTDNTDSAQLVKIIENAIEKKLDALIQKLKGQGVNIEFDIRVGNVYKAISKYIDNKGIDLIVMGSKGVSEDDEVLVGSIAEKVIRYVSCPVITVKEKIDLTSIKSIVYPTDLKEEQETVVNDIKLLQKEHGAHLHIVKVYDSDFIGKKEIEDRMKKFAEHFHLENYSTTVLRYPDEADAILQFAQSNKATMIAMATHNRKGLEVIFNTRISKNVVNQAMRPIWTKRVN